ncbi:MAG: 2-oxoglutarate dehydrogenase complex dihydrolipoyllysine-residue succinyltransferase [Candidatus Binatia bacterium]
MSVEVSIPELGESITEAVIAAWLKLDGDIVAVDEPICELETDKANTEMPAPASGVLQIVKAEGETVQVGDVIARIEEGSRAAVPRPAAPPAAAETAPPGTAGAQSPRVGPAARRVAEELGVDPAAVSATGAGNRVTKQDLITHAEDDDSPRLSLVDADPDGASQSAHTRPATPVSEAPSPAAAATARSASTNAADDEERVPMTSLRRRIAERLVEAQQTAAILTTFNEIDMSRMMELRSRYKESFAERHGVSLGFMGFFARACVEALQDIPQINARIDGDSIIYSKRVHLGIAASTPRGLVVPVVRNAELLDLPEIEREIARLASVARENKLAVSDLTGGTFTISNGGVFGSLLSTPILNPPQSGILGMHKIEKRPVVVNDEIIIRPMMYVALSYDHRIVDGREAVMFLVKVKERIEDPERLLLSI